MLGELCLRFPLIDILPLLINESRNPCAGGLRTRISEETHLKPKRLIVIEGKPLLWQI